MNQALAHSVYQTPQLVMEARADGLDAAVAARDDGPEAAVALSPQDLGATVVRQPFRLNNVALKYIRETHENLPGQPTTDCVDLTDRGPMQVGVINHPK